MTPYEHMVERWEKDIAGDLEPDPHPSWRDFLVTLVCVLALVLLAAWGAMEWEMRP